MKDDELATLSGSVNAAMTAAATIFTEPKPTLEEFGALVTDFRTKLQDARPGGSTLQNSLKDDARDILLESMKQLAFYVNTVADGDMTTLLSSGFILVTQPKSKKVPGVVIGLKLRDGLQSGQMKVDFEPVAGATDYIYALSSSLGEDGMSVWEHEYSTSSSRGNVIGSLFPGTVYRVRARARNNRGLGDWSEVVSLMVR
ncbi:hypothetical protein SAMN05216436_105142 [bacterium A37T11]|nr:hypothetical protein SAMN05216436_105142 [bacterium A37T11]